MNDVTAEVKVVFKELTGPDYKDCWGKKHREEVEIHRVTTAH